MTEHETIEEQEQFEKNIRSRFTKRFINRVSWKALLLRGLLSIIAAIMVFMWKESTLWAIAVIVGVFFFFNGAMAIFSSFYLGKSKLFTLLYGVMSIIAGIIAFKHPIMTDYLILIFIAMWAIFNGIGEISLCLSSKENTPAKAIFGLVGLISIIFGAAILFNLKSGLYIIVWLTGIYLLITGIGTVILSLNIRNFQKNIKAKTEMPQTD